MAIDTTTPRSRRAVIAGAVGGVLASLGFLAKAPEVRAGTDGDLVLEATNNTSAQTELIANTGSPGLRVLGNGIALQGWGDIGVDAYGETIGVNGISDGASAPATLGFNRANSVGVLGWSANGNASTPTLPGKVGVMGMAEQDANARGVLGKTTTGQGVRGEAGQGIGVAGEAAGGGSIGVRGHGNVGVVGNGTGSADPTGLLGAGVQGYGGIGVYGSSFQGTGLFGKSGEVDVPFGNTTVRAITGVYGFSGHDANATGVAGETTVGVGTHGIATSGIGVKAQATTGQAVVAQSTAGTALRATGDIDGVVGESPGDRSGVVGYSGSGSAPAGPAKTGVYGEAMQDASSRGLFGKTTVGQGVRGEATTGAGIRGYSVNGVAGSFGTSALKAGLALQTLGRVRFDKSVGVATIAAGTNSIVVTPGIDLTSASAVVATLMGNAGGTTTVHRVAVDAVADTLTIFLTANATANVKVAWHAFG